MFINELFKSIIFWKYADRIGPDIFWTHWRLYFNSKMIRLCKKKFNFFGENSEIRPGAYIVGCSKIIIRDNVVIRPSTMIHAESSNLDISIEIEENVLIGSGVHLYVENHKFDLPNLDIILQGHSNALKITLKKGCWIGANAIILPGVTIGENSVVAAGAIVTKDVPSRVVVAGNPAKVIKLLD
jgi:acetyltransferase-like isoleucine patch superfamily enzyme